ncbi:MAG: hypothetical protein H7Y01_01260 [Ferruginibacter sp.]|nr:hypothetical protein [Chitinophagaceae bacterium]
MHRLRIICFTVITVFSFSILKAQETDTVLYQRDSVLELDTDPATGFFQNGERVQDPGKVVLVTKAGKRISLSALLKTEAMVNAEHTLTDLDNDDKKELLISNFTGGAHCCDEIYIYKSVGLNKYQYAIKLLAGHTVITPSKEFVYSFHEPLGYFFTCYACGYEDTSDAGPVPLREITLRYNRGKLTVTPGDQELRSTINDNLGKLGEQLYEKPAGETFQDNGLRKEFAMNLAVFYYSFGKNLPATQALFNKYYKYPDAKKVWTAFLKQLQSIRTQGDF